MVTIKSDEHIAVMRRAGLILRDTLLFLEENIRIGMTTKKLDELAYDYIVNKNNAKPSFLNYQGFPGTLCTSIDCEVVHGIPSANRVLEEGMLLKIDCGVFKDGYHTDAARTFFIGAVSDDKRKLAEVTKESFFEGIKVLKDGARLGSLGCAIQTHAEKNGFSVVRQLIGHGVGANLHEEPDVPNYGTDGRGERVYKNMTLAIEPMVNLGRYDVVTLKDGWTVVTKDKSPSAHYENTVVITADGAEILTL